MSLSTLVAALLDFERTPGRWPQGRREPTLLYRQTTAVLMLAAGRPLDGLQALDPAGKAAARRSARFFVRTALLAPGADPYAVLGLPRTANADAVRQHYRLMIRLTHPDFSGAGSEWPPDAATRINLANDVLSSPVRRAALDSAIDQAEAEAARAVRERLMVAAAATPAAAARPEPPTRKAGTTPAARSFKMAGLAMGALAALAGFVMVNPSSDDNSLVARGSGRDTLRADVVGPAPAPPPAPTTEPYRLVAAEEGPAPLTEDANSLNLRLATEPLPPAARHEPVAEPEPRGAPAAAARQASAPVRTERLAPRPTVTTPPVPTWPRPIPAPLDPAPASTELAANTPQRPETPPAPPIAPATEATVTAAATIATVTPPAPRAPKLVEVQPLLARVEQVAQRGQGLPLAMLIHPSTRYTPTTQKFIFDFQDALAGYRITGLVRSEVSTREAGDQLDVDLRLQFNLEDSQGGLLSRPVNVRARFGRVDDKIALVRMNLINKRSAP